MKTIYFLCFLHYLAKTTVAALCVPFMVLTGFRLSKAWRDNGVVAHVTANLWADFHPVCRVRFYNRFI